MEGFLRGLLFGVGTVALLMGVLWIGQGLGVVSWPRTGFMIGQRQWATNGAGLVVVAVVVLWLGSRIKRKRRP
jgi:uncharacterized membrane protein